jgi:hypothetical protein
MFGRVRLTVCFDWFLETWKLYRGATNCPGVVSDPAIFQLGWNCRPQSRIKAFKGNMDQLARMWANSSLKSLELEAKELQASLPTPESAYQAGNSQLTIRGNRSDYRPSRLSVPQKERPWVPLNSQSGLRTVRTNLLQRKTKHSRRGYVLGTCQPRSG